VALGYGSQVASGYAAMLTADPSKVESVQRAIAAKFPELSNIDSEGAMDIIKAAAPTLEYAGKIAENSTNSLGDLFFDIGSKIHPKVGAGAGALIRGMVESQ
jgi:hypothetical protein